MAKEVAGGLLRNPEVLRVRIGAGKSIRADESRPHAQPVSESQPYPVLLRQISSPFNAEEAVGEVRLHPNPEVINNLRFDAILLSVQQLVWQLPPSRQRRLLRRPAQSSVIVPWPRLFGPG